MNARIIHNNRRCDGNDDDNNIFEMADVHWWKHFLHSVILCTPSIQRVSPCTYVSTHTRTKYRYNNTQH